ncbi:hypothetical protein DSM112329_05200 [Paraconexibacter sp. AEG42_29]|uniref:Lipoprotein n=1 Tax=Paraconexibacter sp. AEG42_29 TaxID=2997339 RepID=A0AAU7B3V5_9ACTN
MRSRPVRRGGRRTAVRASVAPVLAALVVAAAGCGGDDGDDGGMPSADDYYGAMNTFCMDVTAAARAATRTSTAAAKGPAGTRVKRISTSLGTFADAAEEALAELEDAGAPERFANYQRENAAGFRRYIVTLRAAAADPDDLAKLQTRVNAIELPDPPQDITTNAKSCASFSPAG